MQSNVTKQMLKITVRAIELGSNIYITSAATAVSLLFSHHFVDVESHLKNLV
jgi:hypothetical protein